MFGISIKSPPISSSFNSTVASAAVVIVVVVVESVAGESDVMIEIVGRNIADVAAVVMVVVVVVVVVDVDVVVGTLLFSKSIPSSTLSRIVCLSKVVSISVSL